MSLNLVFILKTSILQYLFMLVLCYNSMVSQAELIPRVITLWFLVLSQFLEKVWVPLTEFAEGVLNYSSREWVFLYLYEKKLSTGPVPLLFETSINVIHFDKTDEFTMFCLQYYCENPCLFYFYHLSSIYYWNDCLFLHINCLFFLHVRYFTLYVGLFYLFRCTNSSYFYNNSFNRTMQTEMT